MEWKHLEYDISHFVLTGLYILLLFAIGHRMYRLKKTGNLSHLWQRTFMTMLLLGTISAQTRSKKKKENFIIKFDKRLIKCRIHTINNTFYL